MKKHKRGVIVLKEFTLDFSKWCVGNFARDDNGVEKACAWQQAKQAGVVDTGQGLDFTDSFMTKIIQINDSRIARKEKIRLMKAEFKKNGITMKVKNPLFGMPKS